MPSNIYIRSSSVLKYQKNERKFIV